MSSGDSRLGFGLQECLLALLMYDKSAASIISNSTGVEFFEGDYRTIADPIYDYLAKYNAPPCDHTFDLLDAVLNPEDPVQLPKAKRFADTLDDIQTRWNEGINQEYVLGKLRNWVRQQRLKGAVIKAADLLQGGSEDALEEIDATLSEAMRDRLTLFAPGTQLSDTGRVGEWVNNTVTQTEFPTGVDKLDYLGLGPIRKGVHLMIAPPKHGKTQWLVNLGKRAATAGLRVCHVTLEMSEAKIAQRYCQSFFSIPKRSEDYDLTHISVDPATGDLRSLDLQTITPKHALVDNDIVAALTTKIENVQRIMRRVVIKEFPTGDLTKTALVAYLESLESGMGFTPDLLIVDYADLMKVDVNNYRHTIGQTYVGLRGIAVARNLAVATASQSNREGARSSKLIDNTNVAEDYSKIATVDCIVTYNRTDAERELGLARLFVSGGRNDQDLFTVLITQSYTTAQFVLESMPIPNGYWTMINDDDGG